MRLGRLVFGIFEPYDRALFDQLERRSYSQTRRLFKSGSTTGAIVCALWTELRLRIRSSFPRRYRYEFYECRSSYITRQVDIAVSNLGLKLFTAFEIFEGDPAQKAPSKTPELQGLFFFFFFWSHEFLIFLFFWDFLRISRQPPLPPYPWI